MLGMLKKYFLIKVVLKPAMQNWLTSLHNQYKYYTNTETKQT